MLTKNDIFPMFVNVSLIIGGVVFDLSGWNG